MQQFSRLHISDLTNDCSPTEVDICNQKLVKGGESELPPQAQSIVDSTKESFFKLVNSLPNSFGKLNINVNTSKDGNSFAISSSSTVESTVVTYTRILKP